MNKSKRESKNPVKKILILSANPTEKSKRRLDEEVREIDEGLKRSECRWQFKIQSRLAVRLRDLRRALLDIKPQIVHFIGHGQEDGLLVEDEIGSAVRISTEALEGLFELFSDQVECVILSACYSAPQAAVISKHIKNVIGMPKMPKKIMDKAKIEFAVGFYDALGAGRSVDQAFKFGCNAIFQVFTDLPKYFIPVLEKRKDLIHDSGTGLLIPNGKEEIKNKGDNEDNNEKKTTAPPEPVIKTPYGVKVRKLIMRILILLIVTVAFIFIGLIFLDLLNKKVTKIEKLPEVNKVSESIQITEIHMVHIPEGSFLRGTSPSESQELVNDHQDWILEWFNDETPQREIYLNDFYISKYEITNEQYGKFLKDNPNHPRPDYLNVEGFNKPDQPVVGVSWYDADAFCKWLSKKTGETYRLPTEAEWEKAARGNDGRIFPWGNEEPDLNNHNLKNPNFMEQHHKTVSVKEKPLVASSFKLMHMAGNVAEWCGDWYDENHYSSPDITNNQKKSLSIKRKIVRGGAWNDNTFFLRCADRNSYPPDTKNEFIGFRIVRIPGN